jgi:hypothetical protein
MSACKKGLAVIESEVLKLTTMLQKVRCPEDVFTFSRWGDGEWLSILNRGQETNCDGHKYFPAMGVELANILRSRPTYMLGMQKLAIRVYGKHIQRFLEENSLTDLHWYQSGVFHQGAIHGGMQDILDAVNSRKVLVVGPPHLKHLRGNGLDYWKFVEVPRKNNYLVVNETYNAILTEIKSEAEPLLIGLSASMPAEILCDRLHAEVGKKHTIIDFGSLWDPLVGVKSRNYMRLGRGPFDSHTDPVKQF